MVMTAMYKQVEFARVDLYKMVWERPVLIIAKEIGVSDVAVAKACRKAGIPLPSRGHWAIVKSGRAVTVPPLPSPKADQPDAVWFTVSENPPPKSPKIEVPTGPLIEVPTELVKPHRLVAELKAAVKDRKEDKGVLPVNYHKCLRVRTSTAQLDRALIMMDTLIKQFEDEGYKVRVSEKYAETELVLKEGTIISGWMNEPSKQLRPHRRHGHLAGVASIITSLGVPRISWREPESSRWTSVGGSAIALALGETAPRHRLKRNSMRSLQQSLPGRLPCWQTGFSERNEKLGSVKQKCDVSQQRAPKKYSGWKGLFWSTTYGLGSRRSDSDDLLLPLNRTGIKVQRPKRG